MSDLDTFVKSVQAVRSEDGSTIQLQFVRGNGLTSYINIEANSGATFTRDVEQAIEAVAAKDDDAREESPSAWRASP